MTISKDEAKKLRQIGHTLKPVVSVGTQGVTDSVLLELNRALNDHELIKIKIPGENREATLETIKQKTTLEIIQQIGNIALVFRPSAKPNPKLSNLMRNVAG